MRSFKNLLPSVVLLSFLTNSPIQSFQVNVLLPSNLHSKRSTNAGSNTQARTTSIPIIIPNKKPAILRSAVVLGNSFSDNAASAVASVTKSPVAVDLLVYFLKQIINVAVPSIAIVAVLGWFLASVAGRPDNDDYEQSSSSRMMSKLPFNRRRRQQQQEFDSSNSAEELYDDLYGEMDEEPMRPLAKLFSNLKNSKANNKKTKRLANLGIPTQQFIRVRRLNDVYKSYEFSMNEATFSRAYASSSLRQDNFQRALGKATLSHNQPLSAHEQRQIVELEQVFLKNAADTLARIQTMQTTLTQRAIEKAMYDMNVEVGEVDPLPLLAPPDAPDNAITVESSADDANGIRTATVSKEKNILSKRAIFEKPLEVFRSIVEESKHFEEDDEKDQKLYKTLAECTVELAKLEQDFLTNSIQVLGPLRANALRIALLGNAHSPNGESPGALVRSLQQRPLSVILNDCNLFQDPPSTRRVFVTKFPGDVSASQVEELREEVTAIVQSASPTDEAVIILQSGGGTVTGYGLAAAQLRRFKAAGMKLTICVEQVAASGGYMMCCVADRIVASPFAVLGSIGVISEIPNVYERLKKEGIEFQTVTAGKYKRTLTPTKKITKEDLDKQKDEIEDILTLFKNFVKENRPQLDIDNVATGETWFGEDALRKQLCDEIKTKDELLLEYLQEGCEIFEVTYEPDSQEPELIFPFGASDSSLLKSPIRWFLRSIAKEVKNELAGMLDLPSGGVEKSYQAIDMKDTANRVRASTSRLSDDLRNDVEKLF